MRLYRPNRGSPTNLGIKSEQTFTDEDFVKVYAKEDGEFVGTMNYGEREYGERFSVLKQDKDELNVSTRKPKEQSSEEVETVEDDNENDFFSTLVDSE